MPGEMSRLIRQLSYSYDLTEVDNDVLYKQLSKRITWSKSSVTLKELVDSHSLPTIVKVTKGQYKSIGTSKSNHSEVYIHTASDGRKIVAECIKLKEGKKAVVVSQRKYVVPLTYRGWFEVLSEDGQAIRPIQSVQELVLTAQGSKSQKYLVRAEIRGFGSGPYGDIDLDMVLAIRPGDILSTRGEVESKRRGITKRKFVVVVSETHGKMFLPLDMKCMMSPIAGQLNISGVHSANSLLDKFRLPIMVRLVHGVISAKLAKHFTGIFRLVHVFTEETAFVCPMKKDYKMIPISTREPLKFAVCENLAEVEDDPEYLGLQERCCDMYESFLNSIHVVFHRLDPTELSQNRKKLSSSSSNLRASTIPPDEEDILFKEVEDVYDYVREGGPDPPPDRPRPNTPNHNEPPLDERTRNTPNTDDVEAHYDVLPKRLGKARVALKAFQNIIRRKQKDDVINHDYANKQVIEEEETRGKSFDYWEEPLYAPLNHHNKEETIVTLKTPGAGQTALDESQASDIQNLRQIYKKKSLLSKSSGSGEQVNKDLEAGDDATEGDVPPAPALPPKNLSPEDLIRPSQLQLRNTEKAVAVKQLQLRNTEKAVAVKQGAIDSDNTGGIDSDNTGGIDSDNTGTPVHHYKWPQRKTPHQPQMTQAQSVSDEHYPGIPLYRAGGSPVAILYSSSGTQVSLVTSPYPPTTDPLTPSGYVAGLPVTTGGYVATPGGYVATARVHDYRSSRHGSVYDTRSKARTTAGDRRGRRARNNMYL